MIIYYHCTSSNNALLLSFFTNLPSLHPLSFHEMIFILVTIWDTNIEMYISFAHYQTWSSYPCLAVIGLGL